MSSCATAVKSQAAAVSSIAIGARAAGSAVRQHRNAPATGRPNAAADGRASSADAPRRIAPQYAARERAGVTRLLDHQHAVDNDRGARAARKLMRLFVGRGVAEIVWIE